MPDSNFYILLTGITGAKLSNVADIQQNVQKLKKASASPVAIGFGVATPEDAAQVSKVADGVIIGSAIVKRIAPRQQDPRHDRARCRVRSIVEIGHGHRLAVKPCVIWRREHVVRSFS